MAVSLPDNAKRLLDAAPFVVISTLNPDGSPQASVVWAKRDGDDLLISTTRGRRKCRNLERDPRAMIATREYDAPRDLVFEAWTDPRHLTRWFGPAGSSGRRSR